MSENSKCAFCEQDYIKEHIQQKFCCPECRKQDTYLRFRKPESLKREKACKGCGKAFHAESEVLKYCSPECRYAARSKAPSSRQCKSCGAGFIVESGSGPKIYCSAECREKKRRESHRIKHDPKQCAICRESFQPVSSLARFCSDKCRMANAEKLSLRSDYFRRCRDTSYGYGDE